MMMNKRLIANFFCCACLTLATAAEARTSYDGPWNLVFFTQRGSCDPTYTFTVNVTDGIVSHPNLVKFSGYVAMTRRNGGEDHLSSPVETLQTYRGDCEVLDEYGMHRIEPPDDVLLSSLRNATGERTCARTNFGSTLGELRVPNKRTLNGEHNT
jgi:hypothetical protein